jgi:hypothetical protein
VSSRDRPAPLLVLIGVASAALALFTPKIFLFVPLLAAAGFLIAGFLRNERGRAIAVGLGVGLVLLILFASNYKAAYSVTYDAYGLGDASLTYRGEGGGTEQAQVSLPWSKTFYAKSGEFLYLSASTRGDSGGNVTIRISVNGQPAKTAYSSGRFSFASVSMPCCQAD